MDALTQDYPGLLLRDREPPCLSLYQPTHRQHPENSQDPIRFRNLVKQLEESLRQKYALRDIPALLQPFDALAENRMFWNHTSLGLAVLCAPGLFRVYTLQRPVAELAVVANSFHTKPLLRIAQSADRYHILGLNRQAFKVFDGNRDALTEMPPIDGVPQTARELTGLIAGDREGAHRAYGPAGTGNVSRHATDVKQDAEDHATELFFRAVDAAVFKHWSQPSQQHLILAALPQHHHQFRAVSHNRYLMNQAIEMHPDDLSIDALRDRAWQLVLPQYLSRLAGFIEAFGAARSSGRGADELGSIAAAATSGRVETLLIEADRLIPGHVDAARGVITAGTLNDPHVDDVLDDLGEFVLRKGGEVIMVPSVRMPTRSGAAAIYRY